MELPRAKRLFRLCASARYGLFWFDIIEYNVNDIVIEVWPVSQEHMLAVNINGNACATLMYSGEEDLMLCSSNVNDVLDKLAEMLSDCTVLSEVLEGFESE